MPHSDVRLIKTERSAVLPLVQAEGLTANEFIWQDQESQEHDENGAAYFSVTFLRHRPTGFYCKFGGISMEISPGPTMRVDEIPHHDSWGAKLEIVRAWLQFLHREIDAPDLWAGVGQERALANAASSAETDNKPLNPTEKQLASESLKAIKATLLSMQQFDVRQAAIIDNQFKHLGEAVGRVGRKDLLLLTLGSLVTIIVALSLTQEQGNTLLRLAGVLLHQLWDGGMRALGQ